MSSDSLATGIAALASLYDERLRESQIRLLRILPSKVCGDCVHFHSDDEGSSNNSLDCTCDHGREGGHKSETTNNKSGASSDSDSVVHKACRGEGCIGCDFINCELVTVLLEDVAGKFDALSYVWGRANIKDTIKIGEAKVPVTMNLERALRRVRNTEHTDLLWVDAICVNQTDIEERNEQVMRMKEIYATSRKVLVWVGEETLDEFDDGKPVEDARVAVTLLKSIYNIAKEKELRVQPDPYQMIVADPSPFQEPSKIGLPALGSLEWEHLGDFLERPWFSRVWIIQEVAAASEAVVIVGEDIQIVWKELAVAAIWLMSHGYSDNMTGIDKLLNVLTIDTCRKQAAVPLLRRLAPTLTFHSTLQHYKIYALLGMTLEGTRLSMFPRLKVDYNRDWRELFREVVRHCIEKQSSFTAKKKTLHVLSQVRHSLNNDCKFEWDTQQSSWVPNWNESSAHCPLAWRGYSGNFKASKDMDAKIIDSGHTRILSLKGVYVDKIAKTYTTLLDIRDNMSLPFPLEEFRAVAKLWGTISFDWRIAYHNKYPYLADSFARTITADGVSRYGSSEVTTGMYFAAYFEMGLVFASDEPKHHVAYLNEPMKKDIRTWEAFASISDAERSEKIAHMSENFRISIESHKIFFVTEKGYMGTADSITEPGDEVCVLHGGVTPFVVRRVKKKVDCPEWLDLEDEKESSAVS